MSPWRDSRRTLHEAAPGTHAFLWFIAGDASLSPTARALIEGSENQRLLSVASLWEIAIKISIGRLKLGRSMRDLVEQDVHGNGITVLGIRPDHLDELARLPFHHKDPFDRLILAQALADDLTVVSADAAFGVYVATVVW